ncbi:hypothetical protein [Myxococcus sp. Y35]|uniref:hypothetical protein n=1 Tax=Pseudomyxococcus flavus TaxID=3115648 RepID=UPI003CEB3F5F
MNTMSYVLGAVLGAAPGLLPVESAPPVVPTQESRPDSRGTSRKGRGPARSAAVPGNHAVVAPPSSAQEVPDEGRTRGGGDSKTPRHPCEAISIIQVPCDAEREICEYTYWHCPEAVNPLRS